MTKSQRQQLSRYLDEVPDEVRKHPYFEAWLKRFHSGVLKFFLKGGSAQDLTVSFRAVIKRIGSLSTWEEALAMWGAVGGNPVNISGVLTMALPLERNPQKYFKVDRPSIRQNVRDEKAGLMEEDEAASFENHMAMLRFVNGDQALEFLNQ